ncbi:MAG TPA: hypothetical protein PK096_03110 [Candidatus Saccharibacteria bacterium]|nr:hypothetical protein [Candidatus Saccharibacteria bacterium]HRK94331.1 hypothetical protein [Candidatus Saccharibacteria bacterium]
MLDREGLEPKPADEKLIADIRAQARKLLGNPDDIEVARDIEFNYDDANHYHVRKVALAYDPVDRQVVCALVRPPASGSVEDEDRYVITDEGELLWEHVKVDYSYLEQASLNDYDEAVSEWQALVADFQARGLLTDTDAFSEVDELITNYMNMRAGFFKLSKGMHHAADEAEKQELDHTRRASLTEATQIQKKEWDEHLVMTFTRIGGEDFQKYKEKFEKILVTLRRRCEVMDDVTYRQVDASIEANLRLSERLSDEVDMQQAWRLLDILDKCQLY